MFQKVSIKEIKKIKERLKAELEDKNLAFQRKANIKRFKGGIESLCIQS